MLVFQFFFSGRKLELKKVILSDIVLREQNARAQCAAPPVTLRSKWSVRDRWMHRAARLRVNQGEAEGPVSAEAPPWQGAIIKLTNYHSQGMSKA